MWKEIGRTVRVAIRGWGPTVRLVALLTVAAVIGVAVVRILA